MFTSLRRSRSRNVRRIDRRARSGADRGAITTETPSIPQLPSPHGLVAARRGAPPRRRRSRLATLLALPWPQASRASSASARGPGGRRQPVQRAGRPPHRAGDLARGLAGGRDCVTWRLNRAFTFAASGRQAAVEALRYTAVALLAQGLQLRRVPGPRLFGAPAAAAAPSTCWSAPGWRLSPASPATSSSPSPPRRPSPFQDAHHDPDRTRSTRTSSIIGAGPAGLTAAYLLTKEGRASR